MKLNQEETLIYDFVLKDHFHAEVIMKQPACNHIERHCVKVSLLSYSIKIIITMKQEKERKRKRERGNNRLEKQNNKRKEEIIILSFSSYL